MTTAGKQTPALFKAREAAPATKRELTSEVATPSQAYGIAETDSMPTGQVRRAVESSIPIDITPAICIRALRAARDLSDVPFFVRTAIEVLARDPNLRSVIGTRALAVSSLPIVIEPTTDRRVDRIASESLQEQLNSDSFDAVHATMLSMHVYLGFSVAELIWKIGPERWTIDEVKSVDPAWFTFDKTDGRTPYLLPAEPGGIPQPLAPGKFLYFSQPLIPGNPLRSSIAYAAVFYASLKAMTLRGWAGFTEIYGMPIRVGKYPAGMGNTAQGKKDLDVLKRALRDLGGDAWAAIPESMKIEIIEAATRGGSAEVYERLCRFLDEQNAKLVLGGSLTSGTGNTGSGGSQALGVVHNELRADIMHADAKAYAAALRRHVVKPFYAFNYATAAQPMVHFAIEEAEDLAALADAVAKLVPLGLPVKASELMRKFNLTLPDGYQDTLLASPGVSIDAPFTARKPLSASFSAVNSQRDELDDLEDATRDDDDYETADAEAEAALLSAIAGVENIDDLKAALVAFATTGDTDALRDALTAPLTAAAAAGDLGVDVGEQ
jgi:phage gp29-like protein